VVDVAHGGGRRRIVNEQRIVGLAANGQRAPKAGILILVLRGPGAVGDHGGSSVAIGVGSVLVGRRGGQDRLGGRKWRGLSGPLLILNWIWVWVWVLVLLLVLVLVVCRLADGSQSVAG
jgi:hypothetical protein